VDSLEEAGMQRSALAGRFQRNKVSKKPQQACLGFARLATNISLYDVV